jgi:hypothetical protein
MEKGISSAPAGNWFPSSPTCNLLPLPAFSGRKSMISFWDWGVMLQVGRVPGSRLDKVNQFFPIYLILPATLGHEVYSASKRNGYQKQKIFCWVQRGRCVGLTTLPPYVSRLSRQCGILHISTLQGSTTCYRDRFASLFYFTFTLKYRVGQTQLSSFWSLITSQSNNTRENGKVPFVVDRWQLLTTKGTFPFSRVLLDW